MQEIESKPFISESDITLVAKTMGFVLDPPEYKAITRLTQRILRSHVMPSIKQAIEHTVNNRDVPGQTDWLKNRKETEV